MLIDHWPLVGLRINTAELELRLPSPEELAQLADVAAEGIHGDDFMPFSMPWTATTPQERARSVILHSWRSAGSWTPENWSLNLVVFRDGQPMGVQTVMGKDYAVTREAHTGSWLGQRFQGQGVGTQMRTAVLEFAFTALDAQIATSGAYEGNHASMAVSRKLGYSDNGFKRESLNGKLRTLRFLKLERADWKPTSCIQVDGLQSCLELFGL